MLSQGEAGEPLWITVEPVQKTDAGFVVGAPVIGESFQALPDTLSDTARKKLILLSYGVDTEQEAAAAQKAKKPIFAGKINPWADIEQATLPTFLPRRGTDLQPDLPIREEAKLSPTKAALRLREMLGRPLAPKEFDYLTSNYPAGIGQDELPKLFHQWGPGLKIAVGE